MSTTKEEVFAASLRKEISYLEGLLTELLNTPIQDKQIVLKTQEAENRLRQLRTQL